MRILLVFAMLALAGCAEPASPPAAPSAPVEILEDRPATGFGEVATGPAAAPDIAATTAEPPRLVPGEWWRIRFSSPFYDGTPEVVRVVAAAGPDGYLFGMPHEGWYKEAVAYHAPAFGDVGLDLSYATHNERFEPVRFPLVEGASWETVFATTPLVATVEAADDTTATIRLDPPASDPHPLDPAFAAVGWAAPSAAMRLVYDARQHEVVSFDWFLGGWEVVEHGYGFEGWVTIPRGQHTAIDHGESTPPSGAPRPARETEVAGGFNRLTLMQVVVGVTPGAYRTRALAPDGTEFLTESVGAGRFLVRFHEAADPDGSWRLEDLVGGFGGTYSMGIAYHQYDIHLPGGARRSDHSHEVVR